MVDMYPTYRQELAFMISSRQEVTHMAQTDAQKRAAKKYQAAHLASIGIKMRREEAEAFKGACAAANTTPSAVIRAAISQFMAAHPQPPEDR